MYEIGAGKAEITSYIKGVGMMGYGQHFNTVDDIETPLYSRAYVFKSGGKKIVLVVAEIAFITISVKRGVLKRLQRHHEELGYVPENVMLSAQHTHSGPGGYSFYGIYNLSIPGFVPQVYQGIVDGIIESILIAEKNLKPAKALFNKGTFENDIEVAFNRSVRSYNRNPEVKPLKPEESHLAIDREMELLRFDSLEGDKIGSVNWFGVHATSVHNDNRRICADNKGYAATGLENTIETGEDSNPFVAAFAQKPAGDVTPNYVWDKKKKWTRGKFEDDFESAQYNGLLQSEKAKRIYETAEEGKVIQGDLDYELMFVNFSMVYPDKEFTNGEDGLRTGPACLGVAFFRGTKEGPGMPFLLAEASVLLSRFMKGFELIKAKFLDPQKRDKIRAKYKIQGKKDILIETGDRKVLGTPDIGKLFVPGFLDPVVKTFKEQYRAGSLDHKPWSPQTLPLHIVIIGTLAIVGIPGEITTVAGQRLKDTILGVLSKRGVEDVILNSYTNAYCGYITTNEEYQEQLYEGGHTVYGEWTLASFQTKFKHLAQELLKPLNERNVEHSGEPVQFTNDELKKRSFVGI